MDRCALKKVRKLFFLESLFYNIGCLSEAAFEAEVELEELLLLWKLPFIAKRRPD